MPRSLRAAMFLALTLAAPAMPAFAQPTPTATASPVSSVLHSQPHKLPFPTQLVLPPNGVPSNPLIVTLGVKKKQAPVQIQGLEISPPGEYAVHSSNCGTIAPGKSCQVGIVFQPTGPRARKSNLVVTSNASNSPLVVPLFGHGKVGKISIKPRSLGFGKVKVGESSPQKTVTLKNNNPIPMSLGAVVASNPVFQSFPEQQTCGNTLQPGEQCTLQFSFAPTGNGLIHGSFYVNDNAAGNPQPIHVSGTGTGGPTPTRTATPSRTPTATPTVMVVPMPMRAFPAIR